MGKLSGVCPGSGQCCPEFVWGYGRGGLRYCYLEYVWGLWHDSSKEDSCVPRKTNKHCELCVAIDAGTETASYDRSSTKRGHRREEVMGPSDEEFFKERASKRVRDVQVEVAAKWWWRSWRTSVPD